MQGTIANFRTGRHTKHNSQMIIVVEGVDSKEKTQALIGKEVVWKSPAKKEIKGKITAAHGSKGAVRAKFATDMPGQAISQKVEIN